MKEQEKPERFRLLISYSKDVWRGFFQFGTCPGEKFKTIMHGSLNCLGDGYFLGGIIDNLQKDGKIGDYFIVVNPEDFNFVLNKEDTEM